MPTPFDDLYVLEDKVKYLNFLESDLDENNYGQYFSLLEECANEGNIESIIKLSSIYRYGDEFTQSDEFAALQTLKAFFQKTKNGVVAKEIADIYWLHIDDDLEVTATEWYKIAADLGEAESCFTLAQRYQFGWGCTESIDDAIRYYELAISYKYTRANLELAELYLGDPENTEKHKVAIKLLQDGSVQEDHACQYLYATYLESGQFIEQDEKQALMWLSKSAEHENSEAQYKLGIKYLMGNGVDKDIYSALQWLEASADNHFQKAQLQLYTAYLCGSGVEKNFTLALAWLLIAIKNSRQNSSKDLQNVLIPISHLLGSTLNENQIYRATKIRDKFISKSSYSYKN